MLNLLKSSAFMLKTLARPLLTKILLRQVVSNVPKEHQVLTKYLPLAPNTIWDNPGSRKRRKRVGRGPGSGKGKTSGRGMKGKKARSGPFNPRYEGGQTPLHRRVPKSGRTKRNFRYEPVTYVNISQILYYISKGKLDPNKIIDIKSLVKSGAVSRPRFGVVLLGKGKSLLPKALMPNGKDPLPPLRFEISSASAPAIEAINDAGGRISCKYRTKLTLRYHLKPYKFDVKPSDPQPPPDVLLKLERLREKGVEVEYPPMPWFEDAKNKEKIAERQAGRADRAEKFRELGKGVRIKPMLPRLVEFLPAKGKKDKKHK